MRYTRKQAEARFRKLAEFFGKPIGYKPGCWYFDYETVYGGGAIIEVTEDRHYCRVFTRHRLKPREFCIMCDAILRAVDLWQARDTETKEATDESIQAREDARKWTNGKSIQ